MECSAGCLAAEALASSEDAPMSSFACRLQAGLVNALCAHYKYLSLIVAASRSQQMAVPSIPTQMSKHHMCSVFCSQDCYQIWNGWC